MYPTSLRARVMASRFVTVSSKMTLTMWLDASALTSETPSIGSTARRALAAVLPQTTPGTGSLYWTTSAAARPANSRTAAKVSRITLSFIMPLPSASSIPYFRFHPSTGSGQVFQTPAHHTPLLSSLKASLAIHRAFFVPCSRIRSAVSIALHLRT